METQKIAGRKCHLALTTAFFWLIVPAVTYASDGPVVYGMTPGRLTSILTALVGLMSVVIGGLALRSSARVRFRKNRATLALSMGFVCIILSLVHLLRSTGGFGTGSGKLGAIVALGFGLVGMALGGMSLARYRKMVNSSSPR